MTTKAEAAEAAARARVLAAMPRRRPKPTDGLRFHRRTGWSGSSTWGTVTRWTAELDGVPLGAWDRASPLPLAEWRHVMRDEAARRMVADIPEPGRDDAFRAVRRALG